MISKTASKVELHVFAQIGLIFFGGGFDFYYFILKKGEGEKSCVGSQPNLSGRGRCFGLMHQPVDLLHEIVEVCAVLAEASRLLQAVKVVVKHVHQHRFPTANRAPAIKHHDSK